MTTTIQTIEILDFETNIFGQRQKPIYNMEKATRWQYNFPFWIDYGIDSDELARPLHCDFSDVCEWAIEKGYIEDYSTEPKEGWVLIPGTSEVRWSNEKQDAIETHRGRYYLDFNQFLRECLTKKDLIDFVTNYLSLKKK